MKDNKENELYDKIRSNNWKQGSLFFASDATLDLGKSNKKSFFLLITHSCDIVHEPFAEEPYAEAILGKAIEKPNGTYTFGKNPRVIHIELSNSNGSKWYEFRSINRVFFDRKKLADIKPSTTYKIEPANLISIISWFSKKYDRAAFPDSFNNRISKPKSKILDLLKKKGTEVIGFYIRLNTYQELSKDKPYKIELAMIISDNAPNTDIDFNVLLDKIVDKIIVCKTIQVPYYRVTTMDDFTLKDMTAMQFWDFDYLSQRKKPGGSTVKRR